jgi:hypothetical protein
MKKGNTVDVDEVEDELVREITGWRSEQSSSPNWMINSKISKFKFQ